MFSRRAQVQHVLSPLTDLLAQKLQAAEKVFDLTHSNPTTAELPYDMARLTHAWSAGAWQPYAPDPLGSCAARTAIAGFLQQQGLMVDAESLILTCSTSEAYALLLKLLCDPGESVAVPEPSYPLLAELARYENVELVSYPLAYDGAWHIDFPALQARLSPSVKALIVVSPNNPTGSCLKREELKRLMALDVPLICDEVFGAFPLEPAPEACSVLNPCTLPYPENALLFRLDGLSKLACLPQLKLAWTAIAGGARRVQEAREALELMADAYLSASGPVQACVAELLAVSAPTRAAVQARLHENLQTLRRILYGSSISLLHLEAGWYAVLLLPNVEVTVKTQPEPTSDWDWALELLHFANVLLQPGWFYDMTDSRAVVVSLLTPQLEFEQGMLRVVARVTQLVA